MKNYLFLVIAFLSLSNLIGQELVFESTQDINNDNIVDTV